MDPLRGAHGEVDAVPNGRDGRNGKHLRVGLPSVQESAGGRHASTHRSARPRVNGGGVGPRVVLASPASAAITVTLPDQVTVKPGTVVIVKAQTPEGYTCESAWTTEISGKRSIVKSLSAVSCTGGVATWRVKVSQVKRGDAYIYFTATSAPMVTTNDDGSTYTMDPMTEVLDLTLSLKRPEPSSTTVAYA